MDKPYRELHNSRYPYELSIPDKTVLPVYGALQRHHESPRLWSKLFDGIIRKLNLKPCYHEPCLYYTNTIFGSNKIALFFRQVDDFEIACEDKHTVETLIYVIDSKMTIKIKNLGILTRLNGINIVQNKQYRK